MSWRTYLVLRTYYFTAVAKMQNAMTHVHGLRCRSAITRFTLGSAISPRVTNTQFRMLAVVKYGTVTVRLHGFTVARESGTRVCPDFRSSSIQYSVASLVAKKLASLKMDFEIYIPT